ncbi:hypothetical protein HF877_20025 [Rhodococcus sp. BL-253-APC-6A1W]|uniref:hypothetical protein n=1 Tax=Rhodococcus sp. BL-253-APC-6A1W TaxID=2725307 RepID=UPI00146CE0F4|nr:hypothetical protein [Rhodococcus sp. BL-253-APC-6A1W]NMD97661.1 hypothetical protein [Rhodococcus sp. BL-253-APC-6A1W]
MSDETDLSYETDPDRAQAFLDEIAVEYRSDPAVEMGTMFRSPGLRVGGRIFAFLGGDQRLIVKLPRSRALEAVDTGTAHHVTMGSRTMKEWVAFPLDGNDLAGTLDTWRHAAREAHNFVARI